MKSQMLVIVGLHLMINCALSIAGESYCGISVHRSGAHIYYLQETNNKKALLCYRKEDRAMRPGVPWKISGLPDYTTPTATFPNSPYGSFTRCSIAEIIGVPQNYGSR